MFDVVSIWKNSSHNYSELQNQKPTVFCSVCFRLWTRRQFFTGLVLFYCPSNFYTFFFILNQKKNFKHPVNVALLRAAKNPVWQHQNELIISSCFLQRVQQTMEICEHSLWHLAFRSENETCKESNVIFLCDCTCCSEDIIHFPCNSAYECMAQLCELFKSMPESRICLLWQYLCNWFLYTGF